MIYLKSNKSIDIYIIINTYIIYLFSNLLIMLEKKEQIDLDQREEELNWDTNWDLLKTLTNDIEINKSPIKCLVKVWDIGQIKADALIAPINSGGMWFGAIDNVIRDKWWLQFHEQVTTNLNHWDTVTAIKQEKHNGWFDNVVFVIDDLEWPLHDIIYKWLLSADKAWYKTVSMPIMRTWVMLWAVEKTLEDVFVEIKKWIEEFKKNKPNNLKNIIFVVYKGEQIRIDLEQILSD